MLLGIICLNHKFTFSVVQCQTFIVTSLIKYFKIFFHLSILLLLVKIITITDPEAKAWAFIALEKLDISGVLHIAVGVGSGAVLN